MTYNFFLDVPNTLLDGSNGGRSRVIKMPAFEGNLGGYGRVNEPRALVLHTPEEDADGVEVTPKWFRDPRAQASTHYYADNDGDLIQMVAETDCAWAQGTHAGNRTWKGKLGFYAPWNQEGLSNNVLALSIEIEGRAATIDQTITPAQFETVARWIAYECDKWDIPVDDDHVVRHSDLATDRSDPGTLRVDLLIKRARVLLRLDDVEEEEVIESTEAISEEEMLTRFRLAWRRGRDASVENLMMGINQGLQDAVRGQLAVHTDDFVYDEISDLLP